MSPALCRQRVTCNFLSFITSHQLGFFPLFLSVVVVHEKGQREIVRDQGKNGVTDTEWKWLVKTEVDLKTCEEEAKKDRKTHWKKEKERRKKKEKKWELSTAPVCIPYTHLINGSSGYEFTKCTFSPVAKEEKKLLEMLKNELLRWAHNQLYTRKEKQRKTSKTRGTDCNDSFFPFICGSDGQVYHKVIQFKVKRRKRERKGKKKEREKLTHLCENKVRKWIYWCNCSHDEW